ncbi:MAG: hypothetical protein ACI8Z1_002606 [Candidatus Azotimanducaceae bacterium]|jgi:hypothetical protein
MVKHTLIVFSILWMIGCTPTVKLDTSEPITINLNVNIKHEIVIKVDKQLDDLFSSDKEIF